MSGNNRGFEMFSQTQRPDMLGKSDESLNAPSGASKTPQWVIGTDEDTGIFDSDMDGDFAKMAVALWIVFGSARLATYDSSGQQSGDGKIVNRDVTVCMKFGDYGPPLQQWMFSGKKITTITIKRVISVNGTLIVIQELTYGTCVIKTYEQNGDVITFTFAFVTYTDMSLAYDHDGTLVGRVGMSYDAAKITVAAVS
ncbi:MAG: hypothetical protein LBG04_03460 [Holosporaceae bacterium]|jgi:hypothetical protein|nr:hypothetical protein [Holosporaceae bacterium]